MWPRLGLMILLLHSATSLSQSAPDFSGVFLRTTVEDKKQRIETPPPVVLEIKQNGTRLEVIAHQNGASTTASYNLVGKSQNRTPSGFLTERQAELKHSLLATKSTVDFRVFSQKLVLNEKWSLSQDSQQLTIQRKSEYLNGGPFSFPVEETEHYTREESLATALVEQSKAPPPRCIDLPLSRVPAQKKRTYGKAAPIGTAVYQEPSRSVIFTADLSGPFLKGLTRVRNDSGPEFRRKGTQIREYPESVVLEIEPLVLHCETTWENNWDPHPMFTGVFSMPLWPVPSQTPPLDADVRELRFQIRWVGSVERDLGEVPSELIKEMWPEFGKPATFYRLNISAHQVPLTDGIEIQILSKDGQRLAEIAGQI